MVSSPSAEEIQQLASLYDGLGHPVRVCILEVLRKEKRMMGTDLRRAVSDMYIPVDARGMQFHLYKMQVGGIVRVSKEGKRDVVELAVDVQTKTKAL